MTASLFVLEVLVAYRLTTFITTDTITAPWRRRVAKRYPARTDAEGTTPHPVVTLVNCGRCVGVWMAWWIVTLVAVAQGPTFHPGWLVLIWLACAGAVSLLVSAAP